METLYVCTIRITGENAEQDSIILRDQISRLTPEDFEIGRIAEPYPFRARVASCIDAWLTGLFMLFLAVGGAYAIAGVVPAATMCILFALTTKNREHFLTEVQSKYEDKKRGENPEPAFIRPAPKG